jgi:hypothetical protein
MTKTIQYDFPKVGCYIDCSAQSADTCNRRTITFAEDYGFVAKVSGCFDGLRGLTIEMTLDQAESGSHQGDCDEDITELLKVTEIAAQLDKIGQEQIVLTLKECGAWDTEELSDHEQNRHRALWSACCDAKENLGEQLSELGDEAVDFLNSLETREGYAWEFDDNSLFLRNDND